MDEWWQRPRALNAGYLGYRHKRGWRELRKASFDSSSLRSAHVTQWGRLGPAHL